jgi:hypothetical protein
MFASLTAPAVMPFSAALAVLVGLVLLEMALMLIGLTSHLGVGEAGLELDAGADAGDMPELSAAALAELDVDAEVAAPPQPAGAGVEALRFLGLGEAPAMIWLAAFAMGFAVAGFALQWLAGTLLGAPLAPVVAAAVAVVPGVAVARRLSRWIGRLVPSVETYATNSFRGRRGVVTVGVARAGYPANVRYVDGYGTTHSLMAEPLDAAEQIPAGSDVLILRDRQGRPRLVRMD